MTRDEIIKELRCLAAGEDCPSEKCDNTCPYWTEIERGAALYDDRQLCRDAADMLEQDAKTGWISVKDRLPEPGKDVLLIAYGWKDTRVYIGRLEHMSPETSCLTGITSKESEWCIQGWSYLKEPLVTHWMPLPEPPKEETEC